MTEGVALQLRFRGHGPGAAADVDAFCGRAAAPPEAASIAVLHGARPLEPRAPLLVFFQRGDFGIPAPGRAAAAVDLASWDFRPTVFGYLAAVPRPGAGPRRASWVVAACLPWVFAAEAAAAPSGGSTTVQRPRATVPAPPTLPPDDAVPPSARGAEPGAEAPADPIADPIADSTAAQPVPPPEPVSPPSPPQSGRDPAIIDAAWEGVDGFEVELELKGGETMHGRVGAVQRDTFTLIQARTGAVLVLPKSGVLSLRVRMPPPVPKRSGVGSLVGGGLLTAIGGPVFISGVAFVAICPSCTYIHLPLLIIGAGALGGGIPLIVRGTRLRDKYRMILQQHSVAPVISRTPGGWSGGLRFRF